MLYEFWYCIIYLYQFPFSKYTEWKLLLLPPWNSRFRVLWSFCCLWSAYANGHFAGLMNILSIFVLIYAIYHISKKIMALTSGHTVRFLRFTWLFACRDLLAAQHFVALVCLQHFEQFSHLLSLSNERCLLTKEDGIHVTEIHKIS